MKYFYDFHIHSCLSPCSDMEMTPHSIAGMSYINGLNAIAVADHNTARNIRAVAKAAEEYGICVVPGIEAESAENIHLLCLFPTIEAAEEMGAFLESHLPPIKNRPDIFGEQWIMNEVDEKIGEIYSSIREVPHEYFESYILIMRIIAEYVTRTNSLIFKGGNQAELIMMYIKQNYPSKITLNLLSEKASTYLSDISDTCFITSSDALNESIFFTSDDSIYKTV